MINNNTMSQKSIPRMVQLQMHWKTFQGQPAPCKVRSGTRPRKASLGRIRIPLLRLLPTQWLLLAVLLVSTHASTHAGAMPRKSSLKRTVTPAVVGQKTSKRVSFAANAVLPGDTSEDPMYYPVQEKAFGDFLRTRPNSPGAALYNLQKQLGEAGASATVYQCQCIRAPKESSTKPNEMYAVKIISAQYLKTSGTDIENEVGNHRKLKHANIAKLHEDFLDKDGNKFIILSLAKDASAIGNFYDNMKNEALEFRFVGKDDGEKIETDEQAAIIFKQFVDAVYYMHRQGVMHGDLNDCNLLITDPETNCKGTIIDFGLSQKILRGSQRRKTHPGHGTNLFLAPEAFKAKMLAPDDPDNPGYGEEIDWWALGIHLFWMLALDHPFYHDNPVKMFKKIVQEEVQFPKLKVYEGGRVVGYKEVIDKDAQLLIRRLLEKDPKKRIKGHDILNHPWMKKYGPKRVTNSTKAAGVSKPSAHPTDRRTWWEKLAKAKALKKANAGKLTGTQKTIRYRQRGEKKAISMLEMNTIEKTPAFKAKMANLRQEIALRRKKSMRATQSSSTCSRPASTVQKDATFDKFVKRGNKNLVSRIGKPSTSRDRRCMAVREFSSRRDSPVLLRLLEEIREANRRHQNV